MTSDGKWILYNNVERKWLWCKRNEPRPITPKAGLHPNNVMWVHGGLEGSSPLGAPSRKTINSNKYCFRLDQRNTALNKKRLELANRKCKIFHQDSARLYVFWWSGNNCYSLAAKFWFIHRIYQTLHLQISTYFSLYKILLMEEVSIPWKTIKDTWNYSLPKKKKKFWERIVPGVFDSLPRNWNFFH